MEDPNQWVFLHEQVDQALKAWSVLASSLWLPAMRAPFARGTGVSLRLWTFKKLTPIWHPYSWNQLEPVGKPLPQLNLVSSTLKRSHGMDETDPSNRISSSTFATYAEPSWAQWRGSAFQGTTHQSSFYYRHFLVVVCNMAMCNSPNVSHSGHLGMIFLFFMLRLRMIFVDLLHHLIFYQFFRNRCHPRPATDTHFGPPSFPPNPPKRPEAVGDDLEQRSIASEAMGIWWRYIYII